MLASLKRQPSALSTLGGNVSFAVRESKPLLQGSQPARFFASHRWPLLMILLCVACSVVAFTPRFFDYLDAGHWGQSVTKAIEFAPAAFQVHALFGMALIPLFVVQPLLGAALFDAARSGILRQAHRWHGRVLVLAAGLLSVVGFYITYSFAMNSDSVTSVIFMFLVALFVVLFFTQAVFEARKRRIDRHLDALVFAMIFLSVPAIGRLIEAALRAGGVDDTRSREIISVGLGFQVERVDITILLISAVPLLLWSLYAVPRAVIVAHPAKLGIAMAFFVLPFLAVVAQAIGR